jgi:hypothetical protein
MKKVLGHEVKFFLDTDAFCSRVMDTGRRASRAFRLMEPLPDGVYDVMIVDVDVGEHERVRIDVVLTAGSHRGEVVSLRTSAMQRDPLGLMGLPARLRVDDGTPHLEMD